MDFYQQVGKMALGSRLRRLGELMTEQSAEVYGMYGVGMQPKWFPVFYVLAKGEERSISQIAVEIGHSHPSVSTIVKEMIKEGVAEKAAHKGDKRENYVKLTAKGYEMDERVRSQYIDVAAAVETAMSGAQNNIWEAIGEWEYLLSEKSLLERVRREKKLRESREVSIVGYQPAYESVFRSLNEQWISENFVMEASDYKYLDHPKENIIDKNGDIFFAMYRGEIVGTCALIPMEAGTLELSKIAVAPAAKEKGIGFLLGQAAIEKGRKAGAERLYLESNTKLSPALGLYHKLGFKKIACKPSPYQRANICMELIL